MKPILLSKSALFLYFLFSVSVFPQPRVVLTVDESISSLDLGSIIVNNDLRGAPQVFCVDIIPANPNDMVVLAGDIQWQPPESNTFQELGNFTTQPFKAQRICNDQFGINNVKIQSWNSNQAAIDDNRKRGKLTGRYKLSVTVTESGSSATDQKTLEFVNPTQTLTILSPENDQSYDPGNVMVEWTSIPESHYEIKANIRTSRSQSPEDALNSGNPLVNNKNVGTSTSVNLRTILEREWRNGNEIVLQVAAVAGNGAKLYSNIINFKIMEGNPGPDKNAINNISNLLEIFGNSNLSALLANGNFTISEIKNDDGTIMTLADLTALINYLNANPSHLINIQYNRR